MFRKPERAKGGGGLSVSYNRLQKLSVYTPVRHADYLLPIQAS